MRKNKTLHVIAAVCFAFTAQIASAQTPFHFGVKGGLNFSELSTSYKDYDSKNSTGFSAGIMTRIDIKKAYIQAELLYAEKNLKMNSLSEVNIKPKMKNLEVPVVLGYKFVNLPMFNVRGFAGGVYSKTIGDNFNNKDVKEVFNDFDKSNIGYRVGFGADIAKFTVDFSYDGGLNNISNDFKSKPNTWLVTIGYFFL